MVSNDEAGYAEVFLLVICAIMVGCTFACNSNLDFLVAADPPASPSTLQLFRNFNLIGILKRAAAAFIE